MNIIDKKPGKKLTEATINAKRTEKVFDIIFKEKKIYFLIKINFFSFFVKKFSENFELELVTRKYECSSNIINLKALSSSYYLIFCKKEFFSFNFENLQKIANFNKNKEIKEVRI